MLTFPARRQPAPPSPDQAPSWPGYLQVRAALGMPSPGLPSPLSVPCPWCRAGTYAPCVNAGTGQRTAVHQARRDAARPARFPRADPGSCPESHMDDESHSDSWYEGGICEWCGDGNEQA